MTAIRLQPRASHGGQKLLAVIGIVVACVAAGALAGTGNVILAGIVPLVAGAIALVWLNQHWQLTPVVLVIAVSSLAVLLFLPASMGDAGQRQGLETYGLATGSITLVALALTMGTHGARLTLIHPASAAIDRVMVLFIGLAILSALVGFANGNPTTYLVGDVYRIGLLPALYLVTVHSIRSKEHVGLLIALLGSFVLVQHARDAVYYSTVLLGEGHSRIKSVFWIQNIVGIVALVISAYHTARSEARILFVMGALTLAGVGLSRGFRTYIITAAVLLVVPILMRPSNGWRMARRFLPTALVLSPLLLVVVLLVPQVTSTMTSMVSSFSERFDMATSGADPSASQRTLEVSLVAERISSSPTALVVGAGAGAIYELPIWASPYALAAYADDQGMIHNVHNSYGSMALRAGLVGLGAIILLFGVAIRQGYRVVRSWDSLLAWFPFLTIVAYALASPFFYFVPGDIIFAIALGMVGAVQRLDGSEQPPGQSE